MQSNKQGDISVLKGDKLFNENTPFIINFSFPNVDINNKRCNADLICIIDSSRSMKGNKIYQVKNSLKILIDLMDQNDRLALITFNRKADTFFDLEYMTEKNKLFLKQNIDLIETDRGTNILSGLKNAVDILKEEQKQNNKERVSSVILLSDGCDNHYNDVQLADSLKKMTKGFELSFTLHTFGYGYNYDIKIMKKLAGIRDGSFYFVENYNKVSQYFASVLGGCISVIPKKSELNVKLLKNNCKIVKILGEEYLYEYKLNDDNLKTTLLQIIYGKEYSFVLEIKIDENDIKIGEELLSIDFIYEDIFNNNIINTMKLNEIEQKSEAKILLNQIRNWLKENYKGNNKNLLVDVDKCYDIFKDDLSVVNKSVMLISSEIMQNQYKKQGSKLNFSNEIQKNLIKSTSKPFHFNIKKNPFFKYKK